MPKVSICIPAYKPDHFDLALRSALAQSYRDVEIIVSDDCPTDAIAEICDRYGKDVSYDRNPDPSQSNNIKRLASLAQGEYIKFLFDDDVLYPFCVEYLLDLLELSAPQGARLAFSPRHFVDTNNKCINFINHFNIDKVPISVPGREFIRLTAMHHVNLIGEFSTTLFRRADCFYETGEFRLYRTQRNSFDGILDLSAWLELAKLGSFVGHPQALSCFRVHDNSSSNPALSDSFIYCVTYYETIMDFALQTELLSAQDKRLAYQNLIKLYNYWLPTYPVLASKIAQFTILARSL